MDEKDILKDLFLGLLRALGSLFRKRKKSYSVPIAVREMRDRIIDYSGAHKILLLKVTNGKSSLAGGTKMFVTTIDKYENEMFVKRVPEFDHTAVDVFFQYVIMRTIIEERFEVHFGMVDQDSMLHKRWARSGVNMSEFNLIKKSEKEAIIFIMSTTDPETAELNPFTENRMEINREINHLREYYQKK